MARGRPAGGNGAGGPNEGIDYGRDGRTPKAMKLRESGMPEEAYWETLFDVPLILDRLEIDAGLHDVVELGCGYGTFTLPVARRISGTIETVDVDPAMVDRTRGRAGVEGLRNIVCRLRDVAVDGFGGAPGSWDACLLFNILHCEQPVRVLAMAAHSVRPGGLVLVIHWRHDAATPRGPSMEIRPRPEQILDWAQQTNLLEPAGGVLDLPPWHFGLRFKVSRQREPRPRGMAGGAPLSRVPIALRRPGPVLAPRAVRGVGRVS